MLPPILFHLDELQLLFSLSLRWPKKETHNFTHTHTHTHTHTLVASEGDTAPSSCEQSLLSRLAEVLPLLFVVMLSLIVASGHYLLALQSRGAVSTTQRLYGDCKFWHLSAIFRLIVTTQTPIVVRLSCYSRKHHNKLKKLLHFIATFAIFWSPRGSNLVWKGHKVILHFTWD